MQLPAKEEVRTTLLTVLLCFVTLPNKFFVPCTAGSIRSFCITEVLSALRDITMLSNSSDHVFFTQTLQMSTIEQAKISNIK